MHQPGNQMPLFLGELATRKDVFMVDALYRKSGIAKYDHNPLISALPPIYEDHEWIQKIGTVIDENEVNTQLDAVKRSYQLLDLQDFFVGMPRHAELATRIDQMIRQGYLGRNPKTKCRGKLLQNLYENLDINSASVSFKNLHAVSSISLMGVSGVGKSTSVERILNTYPQVIYHPDLSLQQVVWIKVDCPSGGSVKELALDIVSEFDKLLGTDFMSTIPGRVGQDELLLRVKNISACYSLGFLAIDEIQNLSVKKSIGREAMVNFFQELCNTTQVPVMPMGTMKASRILQMDFRHARRNAKFGSFTWNSLKSETEQRVLLAKLFDYQWVRYNIELTEDIITYLIDATQGIPAVMVTLYILAQLRALRTGEEKLSINLFERVMRKEFIPILPMLKALRSNDPRKIGMYEDIVPMKMSEAIAREQLKVVQKFKTDKDNMHRSGARPDAKAIDVLLKMGYPRDHVEKVVTKIAYQDVGTYQQIVRLAIDELGFGEGSGVKDVIFDDANDLRRNG